VPPVYVGLTWGAGSAVGQYQLGLAMQTAWWVTRLPTTWRRIGIDSVVSCLPVGQAREPIALWLGASATPAARAAFGVIGQDGYTSASVHQGSVSAYIGLPVAGYQPALQYTAQGLLLARELVALPPQRVQAVLGAHWSRWLSPHTTDAELASALHVPLPGAPPPTSGSSGAPLNTICR